MVRNTFRLGSEPEDFVGYQRLGWGLHHVAGDQGTGFFSDLRESMGFDIENPKNSTERAIAMGVKDLNPERILRYCEFISVDQVSTSDLGQMVGIPTIGVKKVSCRKFGHSVQGIDLDLTSDLFRQQRCETCPERKSRDLSWKWTFDWEKSKPR